MGDRTGAVQDEEWPQDAQLSDGDPMPRLTRVRRGLSLVEIMVALTLLGIVSGVIMRVIQRQQRFYQGVNQIVVQRSQLRQATSVLPIDLRAMSSVGNDILVASDSSIVFNVTVGTGAVCQVVSGSVVAMPPEVLASGQSITSLSLIHISEPTRLLSISYAV